MVCACDDFREDVSIRIQCDWLLDRQSIRPQVRGSVQSVGRCLFLWSTNVKQGNEQPILVQCVWPSLRRSPCVSSVSLSLYPLLSVSHTVSRGWYLGGVSEKLGYGGADFLGGIISSINGCKLDPFVVALLMGNLLQELRHVFDRCRISCSGGYKTLGLSS